MRVAAIDCGTNSVRLLIAEGTDAGFVDLDRDLHLTRLGQGVDATGRFAPDALARTLDAVADFGARIRAAGAERVRFVATSAARDAANRDEFFVGVRERVGVEAEIITGDEEARLSFTGALSVARDVEWPVLIMDIGGGSTELVLGRPDASGAVAVEAARSLDVGSVRLRERFLASDRPPPTRSRRRRLHRRTDRRLGRRRRRRPDLDRGRRYRPRRCRRSTSASISTTGRASGFRDDARPGAGASGSVAVAGGRGGGDADHATLSADVICAGALIAARG